MLTQLAMKVISIYHNGENAVIRLKFEMFKYYLKHRLATSRPGYYSLGKHRKGLAEKEKKEYIEIFEEYFLVFFAP